MAGPRDPLAAIARPSCSECGSVVHWVSIADLRSVVVESQDRALVEQMIAALGPRSDAWCCTQCDNFGAFS